MRLSKTRTSAAIWLLAATLAGMQVAPSIARTAWRAAEEGSAALLPPPSSGEALADGRLLCAEQRWSLAFAAPDEASVPQGEATALLTIDGETFETDARDFAGGMEIAVPHEAIEPLKAGLRLSLDFAEGEARAAVFSLRGSRRAITAAEEACGPRRLPADDRIVFTPYSPHLGPARRLREDTIAAFRQATSEAPEIAATMAYPGNGGRLLFVELCGSSWYFGRTGCNVAAFARPADAADWRLVLDTEGAAVYLDHAAAAAGWPGLVFVPARGPGEARRMVWDGDGYVVDNTGAQEWAIRR